MALWERHQEDGLTETYDKFIAPSTAVFSKVGNRTVTGSMNELIYFAQAVLDEGEVSSCELSTLTNRVILSAIKHQTPLEAYRQLIQLQIT